MKQRWLLLPLLAFLICPSLFSKEMTPEKRKLLSKKPLIEKIVIQGNRSFSEATIREKLSAKEDGFWQSVGLMRSNRLGKINLYRDKVLLDYFYRSQGFIDANADIDFTAGKNSSAVTIVVSIYEGLRYRVGEVTVAGDLGRDRDKVAGYTRVLKTGEFLNFYDMDVVTQNIKTYFANLGYPYAEITATLQRNSVDSTVAIGFAVARGSLVVFGDVVIDSGLTTRPSVFEHEIVFKRGDIYSRDRFFESQQRLFRTNLFSYVSLKTPDSTGSVMPNFRVSAVERPPRFANLALGAGQDRVRDFVGNFSASVGDRNIGGSARKVRLESSTSFEAITEWRIVRQRYEFSYTEPYLFDTRLPLLLTFKYEPKHPSVIQKYSIRSVSVSATATREFSLTSNLAGSLDYEDVKIFLGDVAKDSAKYRDELGLTISRRLILQYEKDTRPLQNKLNPTSGSYTQYRLEYVGGILGGDNSFVKLSYNWSKYNVFTRDGVFASRLRLGWVGEFGASRFVPSKERFYLGDAYTIRGFTNFEFSPRDTSGNIDGGNAIGLLNLEIRKPLFRLGWAVWGSLFVDCGFNIPRLQLLSWGSPAFTGGGGVQLITPFGPVRLDYAQRATINNVPGGGTFHFAILYAF